MACGVLMKSIQLRSPGANQPRQTAENATHLLKGGKGGGGGGGGGRKWNSGERCHARVQNIIRLQKGEREGEGSGLGERDIMLECKMGGGGGGGGKCG